MTIAAHPCSRLQHIPVGERLGERRPHLHRAELADDKVQMLLCLPLLRTVARQQQLGHGQVRERRLGPAANARRHRQRLHGLDIQR